MSRFINSPDQRLFPRERAVPKTFVYGTALPPLPVDEGDDLRWNVMRARPGSG